MTPYIVQSLLHFCMRAFRSCICQQGEGCPGATGCARDPCSDSCIATYILYARDVANTGYCYLKIFIKTYLSKITYQPKTVLHDVQLLCFFQLLTLIYNNTLRPRQNGRQILTTISNEFSWMKMYRFRLRFHWSLFPGIQLTIFQHWFR